MQLNAQFKAIIYKLKVKNAFWLLKLYVIIIYCVLK